jgi:hypothetical protein
MSIRSLALALATLVAGLAGIGFALGSAMVGPAAAAGDDNTAAIPCAQVSAAISKAPETERAGLVLAAIDRKCHPLPAVVLTALRSGAWEDSAALSPGGRIGLLAQATAAAYPEAETLAVKLIETGTWPSGQPLTTEAGAQLIRSFKGVLTTYRTRLLLDVFEQVKEPTVRQAVIQTLRDSKLDEALLPALAAAYETTGPVQDAALSSIAAQPEKTPAELHARLIRKLPKGAFLDWALRLAKDHPSDPVAAAKKAGGIAD